MVLFKICTCLSYFHKFGSPFSATLLYCTLACFLFVRFLWAVINNKKYCVRRAKIKTFQVKKNVCCMSM